MYIYIYIYIHKTSGGVNDPKPASSTNMCYITMYRLTAKKPGSCSETLPSFPLPPGETVPCIGPSSSVRVSNEICSNGLTKSHSPENAHRDRSSQAGFHVRLGFQQSNSTPPEARRWKISSHRRFKRLRESSLKYEAHHKVPPNKISTVDVNELNFSPC